MTGSATLPTDVLLVGLGADRSIPRRDRHYRALYQRWLGAEEGRALPAEISRHLHEVLLGE